MTDSFSFPLAQYQYTWKTQLSVHLAFKSQTLPLIPHILNYFYNCFSLASTPCQGQCYFRQTLVFLSCSFESPLPLMSPIR